MLYQLPSLGADRLWITRGQGGLNINGGQEADLPGSDLSQEAGEGRLTQVIDAIPLRGEDIRLRVALRVEEAHFGW